MATAFPIYGDQTLAQKLNTAGKPVNLIIGGHSHTNISHAAEPMVVGNTTVVQAHYNGRKVGRADITVNPAGTVAVNWTQAVTVPTRSQPIGGRTPASRCRASDHHIHQRPGLPGTDQPESAGPTSRSAATMTATR